MGDTVFTNDFSRELWSENYKHYDDTDVDSTFHRVASAIASVEATDELRQVWTKNFYDLLSGFKATAGGRITANAGTGRKGTTLMNCLSGDVLIHTNKGNFKAKDLVDKVIYVLNQNKKYVPVLWTSYGYQETMKVVFDNGDVVYATPEHEWIVKKDKGGLERVLTRNLRGRFVQTNHNPDILVSDVIAYKNGVRHGLVYGDGNLYLNGRYSILHQFGDSCHLVEDYFEEFTEAQYRKQGIRKVSVNRLPSEYKTTVPSLETHSKDYVLGFIAGIIAANGCVDKNGAVMLFQSDLALLRQVRLIAHSVGINAFKIKLYREKCPLTGDIKPLYKLSFVKSSVPSCLIIKNKHKEYFNSSGVSTRILGVRVKSVEYTGRTEEVFCCNEPETHSFTLGNMLLTGNCFVGPRATYDLDSLDGIIETLRKQSQTLKSEGGWGMNFSFIRPRGSLIHGIGVETPGAVKYMELYDKSSEIITAGSGQKAKSKKSKIKIRKGAMMGILDVWHPDIEEFITAKQTPGRLTKFNVSVNCSNAFMDKVIKARDMKASGAPAEEVAKVAEWELMFPDTTHPEYKKVWDGNILRWLSLGYPVNVYKKVNALELWDLITTSTYNRAEPGVMFCDVANKTHCWNYGGIRAWIAASNPCVTEDTWVMTSNGPRQVRDLINKKFYALLNGEKFCTESDGFFYTGYKDIYRITTQHGYEIDCTIDHKILCTDKLGRKYWKEAGDLSSSDLIVINNNSDVSWNGDGSYQEGWLVGSLLGDGHFCKNYANLSYWGHTKEYMREYAKDNLGYIHARSKRKNRSQDQYSRDCCSVKSVAFKDVAKDLGLSVQKDITYDIENKSSDFYRGFLAGWFDADGSVQGNHKKGCSLRLTSVNLKNLRCAQRMLARLGIVSSVYENRKSQSVRNMPDGHGGSKEYHCQAVHELVISNESIIKYHKNIGFIDPEKNAKLASLIGKYNRKINKDKFYSRFKSISKIGCSDVYDCTISGAHAFDANGIVVHNCGEQTMPYGSICDLGSLNLTQFVDFANKRFNLEEIKTYVRFLVRFLDNVNDYTILPLPEYAEFAKKSRRIGIGVMGWGSALYMLGIRFGSDKAEAVKEELMRTICYSAVEASIDLAEEKGMFEWCEPDKHADAYFWKQIELPQNLIDRMRKHGIRNSSLFSIQPTGNTGIFANLVSGGMEPVFMHEYIRTSIVNVVPDHLVDKCPDFVKGNFAENDYFKFTKEGDETILRYVDEFGVVYKIDKNRGLTKETLCEDYGVKFLKDNGLWNPKADWAVTTTELTIDEHIRDMTGFAKWIDSAMSKTINVPNDYPFSKFQDVYINAYKTGYIKGVTTYRAGTMAAVLSEVKKEEKKATETPISSVRPKELPCDVHHIKVKGQEYFIIVGIHNGKPYEVFAGKNGHIDKKIKTARVVKQKSYYTAIFDDGSVIQDISKDVTDIEEAVTRLISLSLRNNVPIVEIVKQMERTEGDMYNFGKSITRALKKYIPDGTKDGDICSECGGEIVRESGCSVCRSCGYSKC